MYKYIIIHCSAYVQIQDKMFQQASILNQNFQYYTEEQKIQFILVNMKTRILSRIISTKAGPIENAKYADWKELKQLIVPQTTWNQKLWW